MENIFDRIGHIAVTHKENLLIWGGYKDLSGDDVGHQSKYHDPAEVTLYNPLQARCVIMGTLGDIPPLNSGACGVIAADNLFVFGGYFGDPDYNCNTNTLYRLNLQTLRWSRLTPHGIEPLPCDKLFGWEYKNKLYFFGGFGPPPVFPDREARNYQLVPDYPNHNQWVVGRCWNNQLVEYDIEKNSWAWPKFHGPPPSPRAAHTGFIRGSKVYIFGGRLDTQRMNDLHVLDMDTITWTGNLIKDSRLAPCGRSWHSFTLVSSTAACLYGGFSADYKPLGDLWIYDISKNEWKEQSISRREPRLWHQAVFIDGELTAVGGLQTNISDYQLAQVHAHDLFVITFSPKPLSQICSDVVGRLFDETSSAIQSLPYTIRKLVTIRKRSLSRVFYHETSVS